MFPYSTLLGSTADTCSCQSTEYVGFHTFSTCRWSSSTLCLVRQWIHILRQLWVWTNFLHFPVVFGLWTCGRFSSCSPVNGDIVHRQCFRSAMVCLRRIRGGVVFFLGGAGRHVRFGVFVQWYRQTHFCCTWSAPPSLLLSPFPPPPPPAPPPPSRLPARVPFFPVSPLQTASAVDVSMDIDSASAARRRRERRLRQFLRHERLSVAVALSEKKHHTSRGQGKDRARGWVRDALHGQVLGAPSRSSSSCARKSRAGPGHPAWVSRGGHRTRICSAPWSRFVTMRLWYRFWMHLWRRWWNSCRTSCVSSTRLFPSRLSKCPRSCPMMSLCAPLCAIRSWWNSWWKCRRSYHFPRCSGLWSRLLTFQFLVVEGDSLAFKVFFLNRVQQRFLRSRSLTLPFQEVFKVFAQDKVHLLLSPAGVQERAVEPGAGFSHFSQGQKKCGVRSRPESERAHQCQLLDSGGFWGDHRFRRVGPDL